MKKIKDPIMLGIVAGMTGNIVKNIGNIISLKMGTSRMRYTEAASGIYLPKRKARKPLGQVIGALAENVSGCTLGIGLVYMLKLTGQDHAFIKGIGYSHVAWTFFLGGINVIGVSSFKMPDAKTVMSSFVNHSLYGLMATMTALSLADKDLLNKKDIPADSQYAKLTYNRFPSGPQTYRYVYRHPGINTEEDNSNK